MSEVQPQSHVERSRESEATQPSEHLSDAQVESSYAYMTRVLEALHTRKNGCAEVTRVRIDEIAKDVQISPLQMRDVLARMGMDEALDSVHQRMHQVIEQTAQDLSQLDN